jgi:hypothetical protein
MLFFGFILCWLIGLLTGTLFAFFLFHVYDGPLISEPGPATIIGRTGWLGIFYAACILLVSSCTTDPMGMRTFYHKLTR